jgi:hypothetical protein
VVSYSPEYSDKRDNLPLLRDLATISRGRVDPVAGAIFEPPQQAVGSVQEIGLPLLWLALLLWPLDIGLRRLFLRISDMVPGLAWLRRRLRPQPTAAVSAESLARLNAAKQRARVRRPQELAGAEQAAVPLPNLIIPHPTPAPPPARAQVAPSAPAPQEPPPEEAPVPATEDDQYARLLAAKQRARRRRG